MPAARVGSVVGSREFLGGLALIAIGAFFLIVGWGYRTGTLTRMGPGFLPLVISVTLIAMGLVKVVVALLRPVTRPTWPRLVPTIVVSLLPVAFGLLIRPLGIVLTTAVVVVGSRLALRETPRAIDVVVGLALGGFCAVTFVVALGQAMTIGPAFWR